MAAIPWPAVSPFAPPELQDRHEDCRYLWNEKSRREEEMLPSGEPWCLGAIFLEGEEGEEEEEEEEKVIHRASLHHASTGPYTHTEAAADHH